jgi:flagellar biosynthesis GTPase FlhF
MHLYTFQARSLRDALRLVREELGPDASVLATREAGSALARWLGFRRIEVTASDVIAAPSRLELSTSDDNRVPPAELDNFREQIRAGLKAHVRDEPSLVEQLASPLAAATCHSLRPTSDF